MQPHNILTKNPSWRLLKKHYEKIKKISIKSHFDNDSKRLDFTSFDWGDFYVDISKNKIDRKGFELLINLAIESGLHQAIKAQFTGAIINSTN